jgi:hypothetical protein
MFSFQRKSKKDFMKVLRQMIKKSKKIKKRKKLTKKRHG